MPEHLAWNLLLAAALVLGLGVPKAFSLLYLLLLVLAVVSHRRGLELWPRPLRWPGAALLLFGLSHAALQVQQQVWRLSPADAPEILAVLLLPLGCLLAGGWLVGLCGSRARLSALLLTYGVGTLMYVLLALVESRQPWWNLRQSFDFAINVPWGEQASMNVRSVEQRAYPAVVLLALVPPLLLSPQPGQRRLGWLFAGLGLLGGHAVVAFRARIGVLALLLASVPWLAWVSRRRWRLALLALAAALMGALGLRGSLCDERYGRFLGFLSQLGQAPWGGRRIAFEYANCGEGRLAFHPGELVHNLLLDVYNDTGWLPALALLLAVAPLLWWLLQGFWQRFRRQGWTWPLALRWALLCVLLTQWLLQPFLFADQLMFSLGFLLAGVVLAEFRTDTPEDSRSAMPSHPGTSP